MVPSLPDTSNESTWQVLCAVSSVSAILSGPGQLAIKEGNQHIYIALPHHQEKNLAVSQNLQADPSTMSGPPAVKRAFSDRGPRVDTSHQIRENMLREQDWSTTVGQIFQQMHAAPSLPVVEMVDDTAVHRSRNREPGSEYYGWYRARDQPTNDIAVDSTDEDIQTGSDSIEQALAT